MNRRLHAWAKAYFASIEDESLGLWSQRLLEIAAAACLLALAMIIVAGIVYWPA